MPHQESCMNAMLFFPTHAVHTPHTYHILWTLNKKYKMFEVPCPDSFSKAFYLLKTKGKLNNKTQKNEKKVVARLSAVVGSSFEWMNALIHVGISLAVSWKRWRKQLVLISGKQLLIPTYFHKIFFSLKKFGCGNTANNNAYMHK